MSAVPKTPTLRRTAPQRPTETEAEQAREANRRLAQTLARIAGSETPGVAPGPIRVVMRGGDGTESELQIPLSALILFRGILAEMSEGNAVALVPVHAELTTQEAADLIGVSRPFLTKLIDRGELPCRMVGTHRRVTLDDLMEYRRRSDEDCGRALDEIAALGQELEMGY